MRCDAEISGRVEVVHMEPLQMRPETEVRRKERRVEVKDQVACPVDEPGSLPVGHSQLDVDIVGSAMQSTEMRSSGQEPQAGGSGQGGIQ